MKKVRITAIKQVEHKDLIALYENPIEHACNMRVGDVFVSENAEKPIEFCSSAWYSLEPFVKALANGEGNFYEGWMKNPYSAMISCNDGFRPMSFLLETID